MRPRGGLRAVYMFHVSQPGVMSVVRENPVYGISLASATHTPFIIKGRGAAISGRQGPLVPWKLHYKIATGGPRILEA